MDNPDAVIWWTILGIVIVAAVVTLVNVIRIARLAARVKQRTATYAALPLVTAIERSQADVARLSASAAQIAAVLERADRAVTALRRGPVPPDVIAAIGGARAAMDELGKVGLEPT